MTVNIFLFGGDGDGENFFSGGDGDGEKNFSTGDSDKKSRSHGDCHRPW